MRITKICRQKVLRRSEHRGNIFKVQTTEQELLERSKFFAVTENKRSLQNFFAHYCISHFNDESHILFLAGWIEIDPSSCTVVKMANPILILYFTLPKKKLMIDWWKVYRFYMKRSMTVQCAITIYTPDTDILVVLLYHLKTHGQI